MPNKAFIQLLSLAMAQNLLDNSVVKVPKRLLENALRESSASEPLDHFRELHACYLDHRAIGASSPDHLGPTTAEQKEAICAVQPTGYLTEFHAGTQTMDVLYASCKHAKLDCVSWSSFRNCIQSDESAARLTNNQWRAKFLCADANQNDCLDRTEFESLIGQQGVIESLAFDTTGIADPVEQSCAQIFLAVDKNEDRALSYGEGLKWILDYADESIVGATEQLKKRYYRRTTRATAIGVGHDVTDKTQPILWPGFLAACKEAGVKDEDPLVARDKLEYWAPPDYFPPPVGPPSSEGLDAEQFTKFALEQLIPWYAWATEDQPGRPCRDLLDEQTIYYYESETLDLNGLGHKDGSGRPCGLFEWENSSECCQKKGFLYLWEGEMYGIAHHRYLIEGSARSETKLFNGLDQDGWQWKWGASSHLAFSSCSDLDDSQCGGGTTSAWYNRLENRWNTLTYRDYQGLFFDNLWFNFRGEPQSIWNSSEGELATDWLDWIAAPN